MVGIEYGRFRGPAGGPCCVVGKSHPRPGLGSARGAGGFGACGSAKAGRYRQVDGTMLGISYLSCDASSLEARRPRK